MKSNHCFAVLDSRANVCTGGKAGLYLHDTRHLSEYRWDFGPLVLLAEENGPDWAFRHWGLFEDRSQQVSVERKFRLSAGGFEDELLISNVSAIRREIQVSLVFDADFRDIFEVRGRNRQSIGRNPVKREGPEFVYLAQDGVTCATSLHFDGFTPSDPIALKPREARPIRVCGAFSSSCHTHEERAPAAPWTEQAIFLRRSMLKAERQAFSDIDMLVASSPNGPVVLTGVPNYVNVFGRDSLIASWFLLPAAPDIAVNTLRLLASRQGTEDNFETLETPGKIPHELRESELPRTGDVPFGRYYGTTDASALFVILIRDHWKASGRKDITFELADAWRRSISWCRSERGHDGLLRFSTEQRGRGLTNNSWKDSKDSMSYSDGRLATGQLAVIEVQGYLAAALDAAADLEELIAEDPSKASTLRREATELRDLIDRVFWNDDLGMHALAVDEAGCQCDVVSSNPGHLLWAGVLSEERATAVAQRLIQPDMWTGWGVRCLSAREARYNPLSYHNGSVWPHDNGLIAVGAQRYGMTDISEKIWRGMAEAAASFPDLRLPELFGGYERHLERPPIAYPETCSPQAWSAAALVYRAMTER